MIRPFSAVSRQFVPLLPLTVALALTGASLALCALSTAVAVVLIVALNWHEFSARASHSEHPPVSIASALATIEVAPDGIVCAANDTFLTLTGYDKHDVVGRPHSAITDDAQYWAQNVGHKPVARVIEYRHKTGDPVWIMALTAPRPGSRATAQSIANVGTDITQLMRSAKQNERIRLAIDNSNANLALCDGDMNLVYINQSGRNMLEALPGFSAASLNGRVHELFPVDTEHRESLTHALEHGGQTDLLIGGRALSVATTMITNAEGELIGTVVDWNDRSFEAAVEKDVHRVVGLARGGELGSRVNAGGKQGSMHRLADDINDLLNVSEGVINDVQRVFSAIAEGQLTQFIDTKSGGSFEQLRQDANATVRRLISVVSSIKEVAESVRVASAEIADGNLHLNERTEKQAASLDRTTASMDTLIKAVKENARNAGKANQLAEEARSEAEKGGTVVTSAISAMNEINESSKKISDIIGVINDIAFQTNLLALNASVEAARAGDKGRGFAIVASEVRELAGRSAKAAKEIKVLIETSESRVAHGSRLVRESGDVLESIMQAAGSVTDVVANIATASEDQASGIDAVNETIVEIDAITQRNSALVEQAAAASHDLGARASQLSSLVEFFQLPSGSVGLKRRRSDRGLPPSREELEIAMKYGRRASDAEVRGADQRGAA